MRRGEQPLDKDPGAFRTISEVADEIDVPQHVLRFWETRFAQIRPMKRGGGRRFYRPEDVDLLRGVRHLLYAEGYTIRGVQRILREQGAAFVQDVWRSGAAPVPPEPEEDDAEDAIEAADMEQAEPDFSSLVLPPRGREGSEEPAGGRREPTFPPVAGAAGAQGKPIGVAAEDRRKLQAALDELIACQKLIDAALADDEAAERAEAESEVSA